MITLVGLNGRSAVLDGDKVRLITKGGIFSSRREKVLPVSQITSVEVKEPGITAGYIQFAIAGQLSPNTASTGSVAAVLAAQKDENSIVFGRGAPYKVAMDIKAAVEAMQTSGVAVPAAPQSAADELRKLKGLVDDGILTQAEFDAKKKQLLGT